MQVHRSLLWIRPWHPRPCHRPRYRWCRSLHEEQATDVDVDFFKIQKNTFKIISIQKLYTN